jgi:hypothetical protein
MDVFVTVAGTVLAGIAFDPHIRGILVTLIGVVILCGSIYLILGTNLGARLGFLVALGGLAGWMTIQGLTWWLLTPGIGPRGDSPQWVLTDIAWGDPASSAEPVMEDLPNVCWSTVSRDCVPVNEDVTLTDELLSTNPEWVEEAGADATLSELTVLEPGLQDEVDTGEWDILPADEFGDALAAADEALRGQGVFDETGDYIVLDGFRQGGKEQLPDDPDRLDRIWHTVRSTAQLTHPTHYAVIQVQPVIPQPTVPGEAPPSPEPDPEQPIASVVMVRDLGNERVPGALMTVGSLLVLSVICVALHRRDQLVDAHRAAAK